MTIYRPGWGNIHIGPGARVTQPGGAAAAPGWWVVPGKTCVAAYQPKGAASYVASLVNLATPGTYDAFEGIAPPWAAATGWTGDTNGYLRTGIAVAAASWSMVARWGGAGNTGVCGDSSFVTIDGFMVVMDTFGNQWGVNGAFVLTTSWGINAGIIAILGKDAYWGLGLIGTIGAGAPVVNGDLYLLATNQGGGPAIRGSDNLLAFALYSATLTLAEYTTLYAAMMAL